MKWTQIIDAFRNIQKRFISFLSICLIVMLGSGGFLTTHFLTHGLDATASKYYKDHNFKDYEMISSKGIFEESINRIKNVKGVLDAEGIIQFDGKISYGTYSQNVDLMSVSKRISVPEVIEGRMPTGMNECALPYDIKEKSEIRINDTIHISSSFNENNVLRNDTYKVVGFYNHPDYIRKCASYSTLVSEEAFDQDVLNHIYTRVLIKAEEPVGVSIFEDEYFQKNKYIVQGLKEIQPNLRDDTITHIVSTAQSLIDEKWKEIEEQFLKAQQEIDANKKLFEETIASYRAQLEEGRIALQNAYDLLNGNEVTYANGERELKEARKRIAEVQAQLKEYGISAFTVRNVFTELKDLLEEYIYVREHDLDPEDIQNRFIAFAHTSQAQEVIKVAEQIKQIEISDYIDLIIMYASLDNLKEGLEKTNEVLKYVNQYIDGLKLLEEGERKVAEGRLTLDIGWNEYFAKVQEYESGKQELESQEREGRQKLLEAQAEFDRKYKEAQEEFEKYRNQFEDVDCDWVLLDRYGNTGYVDVLSNIRSVHNAGVVYGFLFLFVGGLVVFSTLAMIVEEEKKYVGTTKAFGFHNNEILNKYLMFGVMATIVGMILSVFMGKYLSAYILNQLGDSKMYLFGYAKPLIILKPAIMIGVVALIISVIVITIACTDLLRSPASILMKGYRDTKETYQKDSKSNGSSKGLYSRLILRNMLTDWPRVLISIVIVAGSCLVIGVGFMLNNAFNGMLEMQDIEVNQYDIRIDFGDAVTEEEKKEMAKVLTEEGVSYCAASLEGHLYETDERLDYIYLLVADESIQPFISIHDPDTKEPIIVPSDGILVQNRIMETQNREIGDSIHIYGNNLKEYDTTIQGSFQNYQGRLLICGKGAYKKIFGVDSVENCYYAILNGVSEESISNKLTAVSSDISIERVAAFKERYYSALGTYRLILVVSSAIGIAMSFMILTNLANILLARKKKELIVMRINGFSISKTIHYLAKETIITTLIGLVIGATTGILTNEIIVRMVEQPDVQFLRTTNYKLWGIAILIEASFAFLLYAFTFRKVKNLNFRDIL